MTLLAFKGVLCYELQVGTVVVQVAHSGGRIYGKRFHVWRDPFGKWRS